MLERKWYEDFFYGVAVEFWRKVVPEEFTQREVGFLEQVLNLKKDDAVLDVPSGTGRHSLELAQRGYRVTALDISGESIDLLRQAAEKRSLWIECLLGDVLKIELAATFNGAYCLGNSFGYFDYQGTVLFVEKIARWLKPGARFLLNSGAVAESILPNLRGEGAMAVDDITFVFQNTYHPEESVLETAYQFIQRGETDCRTGWQYVYTLAEIKRLLAGAGLKTQALYSSTEKGTFKLGDPQLYLVAEKE
jgi:cyclopropane fatty-acyl-phospholipid synthase-like methyltransferase